MSDMDAATLATLFHRLQTAADDSFTRILGTGESALRTLRGISYRAHTALERPDAAQAINSSHDLIQKQLITAAEEISAILRNESYRLKPLLWAEPPPPREQQRGHLGVFIDTDEPVPPRGAHYVPAPLTMPPTIDITIGEQKRKNCYLIAAVNAVAHWDPNLLEAMVRPDPDDENYVIVRVAAGTYHLPATLPVDDETGDPAHATSPDGSTLVAYLEKAAAAHLGSWDQTDLGDPTFALRWLIGDKLPHMYGFDTRDLSDDNIDAVLSAAKVCLVVTPDDPPDGGGLALMNKHNLSTCHVYTAKDYSDGTVTARNPTPELHPGPLSVRDLKTLNARLAWASESAGDASSYRP